MRKTPVDGCLLALPLASGPSLGLLLPHGSVVRVSGHHLHLLFFWILLLVCREVNELGGRKLGLAAWRQSVSASVSWPAAFSLSIKYPTFPSCWQCHACPSLLPCARVVECSNWLGTQPMPKPLFLVDL